jgi:hypothetical protein
MTTAVVVDIAPADESSPDARSMLGACNVGMHTGRCVFGRAEVREGESIAFAIVAWEGGDDSKARVSVGLRLHGQLQWQTRFLSFSDTDPGGERWKTVGFAIATTVGEAVARDAITFAADSKVSAVASLAADEVRPSVQAPVGRSWIDAQLAVSGSQGRPPAVGGELRFSSRIFGDRMFVSASVGCTVASVVLDSLSLLRPSGSAGGGLALFRASRGIEFDARAHGLLELIDATATDPATGARQSGGRWMVGLGEGLDASWMWSAAIGVTGGVELVETLGPTEVTVHGQTITQIPAVELGAAAGLRIALP